MFRRPVMMRRGPGLVGTVARTAVIAGTATAVSRGVSGAMQGHAQDKQQEEMAEQAALQSQSQIEDLQSQLTAMQAQQAQAVMPQASAPAAEADLATQLQQIAQLKNAGVLSDAEFEAAKAKLLGTA